MKWGKARAAVCHIQSHKAHLDVMHMMEHMAFSPNMGIRRLCIAAYLHAHIQNTLFHLARSINEHAHRRQHDLAMLTKKN